MSYTLQPMIITPAPPEEPIEDLYNHRISVLLGMIYNDNPFTIDYYHKSYIAPEYLSGAISDHLMSLMIRRDLTKFKKVYRFIQTRKIPIIYTSGLNIWFVDFIKNNLLDMIHPEMATMKLNSDNIIYLAYGRPSKIHTKLMQVFKDVKIVPDVKKLLSSYTTSIWNYIDIYRFLNSLSDENIINMIINIRTGLHNAYAMDIIDVKINPTLLKMLLITIKKRRFSMGTFTTILKYLNYHTNISEYHIREIICMHHAMVPHIYRRDDAKIFI